MLKWTSESLATSLLWKGIKNMWIFIKMCCKRIHKLLFVHLLLENSHTFYNTLGWPNFNFLLNCHLPISCKTNIPWTFLPNTKPLFFSNTKYTWLISKIQKYPWLFFQIQNTLNFFKYKILLNFLNTKSPWLVCKTQKIPLISKIQ